MRRVDDLSRNDATDIVSRIVDVMYLDFDEEADYYDPDKSLEGADFIDSVATVLGEYDLVPKTIKRLE